MRSILFSGFFIILNTSAFAQQVTDQVAPESAGAPNVLDRAPSEPVKAKDWMVAAANPLAVKAGAAILEQGGTAADAMIAVQAALGLVEPQSSGLGGGAYLLWYDAEKETLTTLDGRETAPMAARPTLFLDENGAPLKFYDAVVGGRSVGIPGTPALMEAAHERWGKLDWETLFEEPIKLADGGFDVSPRLASLIAEDAERLSSQPDTAAYFLPEGTALSEGQRLKNPAYAETLKLLAEQGADVFYTGEIADDIIAAVTSAPGNPGQMNKTDFALYNVVERAPVCAGYRGYDICGMGPSSSGGIAVGQILGALEPYDLKALGAENPESWRLIGDATRLAFADRGRYVADTDFVPVPVKGLLAPDYLKSRSELLRGDDALPEVAPGKPEFDHALNWADGASHELPSTTHIVIVDADGNVLSMTSTIENGFGSRVMARGFLLNNELTDFSFSTHENGAPVANRVEPGKRPRSSMSPTIVMKDDKPVLAVGSPGGSRIIPYVAKTLVSWIDWDMNIQEAINQPHLVNRFGTYDLEEGTKAAEMAADLQALGYEISVRDLTSGLHGIEITTDGLEGGADPRREGIALGE